MNARIDAVNQQLVDVKMEVMSTNEKIEKRTDAPTAKGEFSSYLAVGGAVFTVTSTIFALWYSRASAHLVNSAETNSSMKKDCGQVVGSRLPL